jgi:Transposase and inactivated derivatives
MSQSLSFGKSVKEIGWGMFTRMLGYKALWKGKYLIKVSKFFPSSKKCSVCGYLNKNLTLNDRTWVCSECGTAHDRDINAAVNIRNEGIRLFNVTKGTVGTTGTSLIQKDRAYVQGDCVRPVHDYGLTSEVLSCIGNDH